MDMSKLSKMPMPVAKPAVSITLKPRDDEKNSGGPVANPDLEKFSELDLLDELKSRGCVDDDQYSAIESKIDEKSPDHAEDSEDSGENSSESASGSSY